MGRLHGAAADKADRRRGPPAARRGGAARQPAGRAQPHPQGPGLPETPQAAHRLLARVGYWSAKHNPYPARCKAAAADPDLPVPTLPDEERLDLTHLPAFAIDDEGNQDPDDAVSLDGERIWVHVADVAALVAPDRRAGP
jgi:hypothetical protein